MMRTAQEHARRARAYVGGGLPFDVKALAKSLGIEVRYLNLPRSSGRAAMVKDKAGWLVTINVPRCPRDAERFQLAHEVGHVMLSISLRGRPIGRRAAEAWCDAFAAELLMPEEDVRREAWRSTMSLMCRRYGVSKTAMTLRLRSLGLTRVVARSGRRASEPAACTPTPIRL